MKKGVFLVLFLYSFIYTQAQGIERTVTGTILDKDTKDPVEFAGIRVLNAKDSAFITGTAADIDGRFKLSLSSGKYIIQTSFIGYSDHFNDINISQKNISLGDILLSEDAILLSEAVVTAKAIEIQVKGDTVEYNADSYKVPQNAVVEDLLKKMPGVEISSEGTITVNGKEVKRILVDGKEFFSDDPKVASKNFPAEVISKLQVLDKKSDMSQMTGFDDGEEETVINLTMKPDMKEGMFGNLFAGYGSKDRYEAGGMVNYMKNNTQITALGGINNTNNAGFSDFASSMFGGNRPGPGRGMNFGGNNGVAKTANGGLNFSSEYSDILKWGGNIRYGNIDNDVSSTTNRRYTGIDRTENSKSWGRNKSDNFGLDLRFEWTPDSLTRIIFRPMVQYNKNLNIQQSESDVNIGTNAMDNYKSKSYFSSDGHGIKLDGVLEVSRKLNSKGRTLAVGLSGGLNDAKSDGLNWNQIDYTDPLKADSILNQRFDQKDKTYNWRANVSYVEPIGRNNFLQLSYNIRNNNSTMDKVTYDRDVSGNDSIIANDYTRKVKNDFINQNISLNFKAVRAKYNYTIGVGLEPSSSKTDFYQPGQIELTTPRKNFLSFAPNGQFNYMWDKRHNLRVDYKGKTQQPTTMQLYDGITAQDGLNITRGNPNLRPSFENKFNIRYQNFSPERGSTLTLRARFIHTMDDIVSVSSWDNAVRSSSYKNINGNWNTNARIIYNSPLRNNKFSINTMTYLSYAKNNTFISVDDQSDWMKNTANTYDFKEVAGIVFRSDYIDFGLKGNFAYNNVRNTISNNNQEVFNYGGAGDFTFRTPVMKALRILNDITIQSDIEYLTNSGYSDGFKQNQWLWNASISKMVFKDENKWKGTGTIRVKIYDLLGQRNNISRTSTSEYIQDITSNTINSYFMVNFVYNFKMFKGGISRGSMEENMRPGGGRPPHGNRF